MHVFLQSSKRPSLIYPRHHPPYPLKIDPLKGRFLLETLFVDIKRLTSGFLVNRGHVIDGGLGLDECLPSHHWFLCECLERGAGCIWLFEKTMGKRKVYRVPSLKTNSSPLKNGGFQSESPFPGSILRGLCKTSGGILGLSENPGGDWWWLHVVLFGLFVVRPGIGIGYLIHWSVVDDDWETTVESWI